MSFATQTKEALDKAAGKLPKGSDRRTDEEIKKDDEQASRVAVLYRMIFGGPKK